MANPTKLVIKLPDRYAAVPPQTEGDPLPLAEIADILIAYGQTKGGPYPNTFKDTSLAPDANGDVVVLISELANIPAVGTTYVVAFTDATNGQRSDASTAEVSFTMDNRVPNPPQGLTVA